MILKLELDFTEEEMKEFFISQGYSVIEFPNAFYGTLSVKRTFHELFKDDKHVGRMELVFENKMNDKIKSFILGKNEE